MDGLILYIMGVVGVGIHFLWKIYETYGQKRNWEKELLSLAISTLVMVVMVFGKEDLEGIMPVTRLGATIIGYSAQSIFRKVVNIKIPKHTNGGIN